MSLAIDFIIRMEVPPLMSDGIAHTYEELPLTPKINPIKSLQEEPMRPGYKLMMAVETLGNGSYPEPYVTPFTGQ